jgi:hypothetical protein
MLMDIRGEDGSEVNSRRVQGGGESVVESGRRTEVQKGRQVGGASTAGMTSCTQVHGTLIIQNR